MTKKLMIISIIVVVTIISIVRFWAYYSMQDKQLNSRVLHLKFCGDDFTKLSDAFTCEDGICQIQNRTMRVPTKDNQTITAKIVDREWRYGQPILYILANDEIGRYCLK